MATFDDEACLVTIGNERYLRYVLLVGQGGTVSLREILKRDLGSNFSEVIRNNRALLKMEKRKMERIFSPVDNSVLDINKWDISLLSTLILQLCKKKTPNDELISVRLLTNARHELAHAETFSRDEEAYKDECEHVAGILMNLCKGLDYSIQDMCQKLIENCKKCRIDRHAALEMLTEIRKYDRKIFDQLENLTVKVEKVLKDTKPGEEKVNIIREGIKELKKAVKEYIDEGNAACRSFFVLESKITLRGRDAHLTALAEEALVTVFNTASFRIQGEENLSKLTTETRKLLDDLKRNGVTDCGADQECVKVKMKCDNYSALLKLLDFLQSEMFCKRLESLVEVLDETDGNQYQITYEIHSNMMTMGIQEGTHRKSITDDSMQPKMFTVRAFERKSDMDETERLKLERPAVIGADVSDCVERSPRSTYTEDAEVSKLLEENKVLLDDIAALADIIDDDNNVILLIGQIGAGKSSLINTIHKVLTDRYFIIAPHGRGVSQSVTTELIRYDKCGTKMGLIESIPDEDKKQKVMKIFDKLPQIIDFAGLGDVNTPQLTEILELLIGGFLPTRISIQSLERCQKDFGIGALKRLFPVSKPDLQVTKIAFLHSFTDVFPEKLIQCLNNVLNNYQEAKVHLKCKPDVFILATKFDLVRLTGEKLQNFEKVEKRLTEELNRNERSFRWISFHDGLNFDKENVENLALKFLKCVLEPGTPPQPQPKDVGLLQKASLQAFRMKQCLQQFLMQDIQLTVTRGLFLSVFVCVIAFFLAFWLLK